MIAGIALHGAFTLERKFVEIDRGVFQGRPFSPVGHAAVHIG
jgi:hypothetical protein